MQLAQQDNLKRKEKEEKEKKAKEKAVRISFKNIIRRFLFLIFRKITRKIFFFFFFFLLKESDLKKKEAAKQKPRKNLLDDAGDEEGVLDGLMQALQNGSAFRDPSRPNRKRQPRKGFILMLLIFQTFFSLFAQASLII